MLIRPKKTKRAMLRPLGPLETKKKANKKCQKTRKTPSCQVVARRFRILNTIWSKWLNLLYKFQIATIARKTRALHGQKF